MSDENSGIRFAYIRDPQCRLRYVTIAYTCNPAIQGGENPVERHSLTYAFAINRVDTHKRAPHRVKNHETFELHRKSTGREIAGYRLRNLGRTTVGQCYVNVGESPVAAIIAEHIRECKARKQQGVQNTPMYLYNVFKVFTRLIQLTPTTERKS